jgi:dGTPase
VRRHGRLSQGLLAEIAAAFRDEFDLRLGLFASLEAQAAALADDIAYDCHDLEDGLRAGLLGLDALSAETLTAEMLRQIRAEYPGLELPRVIHELVRRLMSRMIADVLAETERAIDAAQVERPDDVRQAGQALVRFSPGLAAAERQLKAFLFEHLYRNAVVMGPVATSEAIITDLFEAFVARPALMPDGWGLGLDPGDPAGTARRAADYIAGMTDRYAVAEHRRLFDATPDLG